MVLITIVNGVYKPTYNWGAPPCMEHKIRWFQTTNQYYHWIGLREILQDIPIFNGKNHGFL
jgi:hypothetical protein